MFTCKCMGYWQRNGSYKRNSKGGLSQCRLGPPLLFHTFLYARIGHKPAVDGYRRTRYKTGHLNIGQPK